MRTLSILLIVPAVLLGLERYRRFSSRRRGAYLAFLGLASAAFWVGIAGEIRDNLRRVPEWDFLGFWLHARTAVAGGNFYDPSAFHAQVGMLDLSRAFRAEIADTGFWYPPPSMFLFWPLGWFELHAALALWYALHLAALAACVPLLRRIFFPGGGSVELAACATLVALAPGTLLTVQFAQTNFVALLALLLFWGRRETAGGGAWAAVALFVKPFLAVLALGPLLERRRRALAGFLIAVALLTLASIVAFGPRTCADYVLRGPLGVKPDWIYFERTNQSLLGWLLRLAQPDCSGAACVRYPPFVAAAALLGGVTLLQGIRLARAGRGEWALCLLLVAALLAYPVSQVFYSLLLVPVMLLFWRCRDRLPGGAPAVALGAGLVLALCAYDGGDATVAAFGTTWAALALVAPRRELL